MCCWDGYRSSTTGVPYLVEDPSKVWIGLEYFCYETDALWKMPDDELKKFAIAEVAKIGILDAEDVIGCACGARAEDLSGVLRDLRPLRRVEGRSSTRSRTCSWSAATGCTSTTTRTTRMLTAMHVVDGLAAGTGGPAGSCGRSTPSRSTTRRRTRPRRR